MVIIGYPGIGKTTLVHAQTMYKIYIDLESSCFHTNKVPDNWQYYYIKTAIDLHNQGFRVFISSHISVREELHKAMCSGEIKRDDILIVHPDLELKDRWIEMLENRYKEDPSDKNERALQFAKEYYESSIKDLLEDEWAKHTELKYRVPVDDGYNLDDIINEARPSYME